MHEWATHMKQDGTPGDDIALDALATMLEINFLLHLPDSPGCPIHFPAISGCRYGNGYLHLAQVPLAGV